MVTSMRLQIVIANDAISGYPDRNQIVKKITVLPRILFQIIGSTLGQAIHIIGQLRGFESVQTRCFA